MKMLQKCYVAAFDLAFTKDARVACPLIGAGARGFPIEDAISAAVNESLIWRDTDDDVEAFAEKKLLFGIPDVEVAQELAKALNGTDSSRIE